MTLMCYSGGRLVMSIGWLACDAGDYRWGSSGKGVWAAASDGQRLSPGAVRGAVAATIGRGDAVLLPELP